jgi:hypothetical protein
LGLPFPNLGSQKMGAFLKAHFFSNDEFEIESLIDLLYNKNVDDMEDETYFSSNGTQLTKPIILELKAQYLVCNSTTKH